MGREEVHGSGRAWRSGERGCCNGMGCMRESKKKIWFQNSDLEHKLPALVNHNFVTSL